MSVLQGCGDRLSINGHNISSMFKTRQILFTYYKDVKWNQNHIVISSLVLQKVIYSISIPRDISLIKDIVIKRDIYCVLLYLKHEELQHTNVLPH